VRRLKTILISIAAVFALIFLILPVDTKAANAYVVDETGILTTDQILALNSMAEEISLRQECGVYVIITKDRHGYSEDDYARGLFMNYDLGYGVGDGASGVLLAISYKESFFDCVAYGAAGDTFTRSRLDALNDLVFDHLKGGDWYGGVEAFIKQCDTDLTNSGYQYYVPVYTDPTINQHIAATSPEQRRQQWLQSLPFAGLASALISLIVTWFMKQQNVNTGIATEASRYLVKNGVKLKVSQDNFINRTRTVTVVHRDSGGGGGGGGGHSYHSSGFSSSSGGRHF
jgi:uncharacterized protein